MIQKTFKIVYADESVIAGVTRRDFETAPTAGILFVIILYSDGHIERHKALDVYEYQGARKLGAWTTDENYQRIKDKLPQLGLML